MKTQTALEQLITEFEVFKAGSKHKTDIAYCEVTILLMKKYLPTEQQQIIDSFDLGKKARKNTSRTGSDYFKFKYTDTKTK